MTTPQTSLDVADWPVARPLQGLCRSASTTGSLADAGSRATGDPGVSPDRTHTGWLARACRSVTPPTTSFMTRAPVLLDAQSHPCSPQILED